MNQHIVFMQQAITLAEQNVEQGGGPFGAVIVKDEQVIGTGSNQVTLSNDPTAHAEIVAIRAACAALNSFYSSCEPCPMCLSAIYWARIPQLYFGSTHTDAEDAGFRDDFIYKELSIPIHERSIKTQQILREEALSPFKLWELSEAKILY